jgi:hypothetical protein
MTFYAGAGYAKWLEDGAPDGGLAVGGGLIYELADMPLAIGGEVQYLMLGSVEGTTPVTGGTATLKVTTSTIPITGQVYYMTPAGETSDFYGTAGFGVYMMRAKMELTAPGISQESTGDETEMGMNVGGGMIFGDDTASMKFGFDAKFHLIFADETTNMISAVGKILF